MFEPSAKLLSNGDLEVVCTFFTMGHIVRHRDLAIKGYGYVDGTRTQGSPVKLTIGKESEWGHFFELREHPSAQGGKHGVRTLTRKIRNAIAIREKFSMGADSIEDTHKFIQRIGRICYGKTESDTSQAKGYFDRLVHSKHFSVMEHISAACKLEGHYSPKPWERVEGGVLYTNMRALTEFGYAKFNQICVIPSIRSTRLLHLTSEELHNLAINDRTASITAESMRYSIQANGNDEYLKMLADGAKPEDARLVLPVDTVVRVYVTQYDDRIGENGCP